MQEVKTIETVRILFWGRMLRKIAKDFARLANGSVILSIPSVAVVDAQNLCAAEDSATIIQFHLERSRCVRGRLYKSILENALTLIDDPETGVRMYRLPNRKTSYTVYECNSYEVIVQEPPTPERALELVQLCLNLAEHRVS